MLQEVAVAKKVYFACGHTLMEWETVYAGWLSLNVVFCRLC